MCKCYNSLHKPTMLPRKIWYRDFDRGTNFLLVLRHDISITTFLVLCTLYNSHSIRSYGKNEQIRSTIFTSRSYLVPTITATTIAAWSRFTSRSYFLPLPFAHTIYPPGQWWSPRRVEVGPAGGCWRVEALSVS